MKLPRGLHAAHGPQVGKPCYTVCMLSFSFPEGPSTGKQKHKHRKEKTEAGYPAIVLSIRKK